MLTVSRFDIIEEKFLKMASRSLTDVFILMRNNASQSRHIYSEQNMTDRMSLVGDPEIGLELKSESRFPPVWSDNLEECHYAMSRLRTKLNDLKLLYDKHLMRPTLDDSTDEEQQIEVLTQEITRMFGTTHKLVQQIRHHCSDSSSRVEKRLSYNVTSSLVSSLQELSGLFRKLQSSYLKRINSREERSRQYFDVGLDNDPFEWELDSDVSNIDRAFSLSTSDGQRLQPQTQLLLLEEENTKEAVQRDQEVKQIVKSIVDLSDIFKDLAHMVTEQGSILDRIDYNIEQTQIKVHQGYQQLQKADLYQRKNRKMMCILILASVTMFLTFLLIIVKT
uniref:t-SNARE coiled-coil homology domain-containing protein n=3 Tax=Clastoptera arizonana TaxID=38151 RepID=A0A1B6EA29_9HEMI